MTTVESFPFMANSADFDTWADDLPNPPELCIPGQEDGIIAELINVGMTNEGPIAAPEHADQFVQSPVTAPCTPCVPFVQNMIPLTPLKRKASRSAFNSAPSMKKPALVSGHGSVLAKCEPSLPIEPLTPSPSSRALYHSSNGGATSHNESIMMLTTTSNGHAGELPLSPLSESGCSDDEDSVESLAALPSSPLPTPSKAVAARRRAMRSKALKRSRSRYVAKDESCLASSGSNYRASVHSAGTSADNDGGEEDSEHPVDKKIARAIRNRQAAQRSRVEAKAKMTRLAVDNDELAFKVESLRAENAALNKQLEALVAHSFGEGHDVKEVLALFERVKSSSDLDMFNK